MQLEKCFLYPYLFADKLFVVKKEIHRSCSICLWFELSDPTLIFIHVANTLSFHFTLIFNFRNIVYFLLSIKIWHRCCWERAEEGAGYNNKTSGSKSSNICRGCKRKLTASLYYGQSKRPGYPPPPPLAHSYFKCKNEIK